MITALAKSLTVCALFLLVAGCSRPATSGMKEAWNSSNDPLKLGKEWVRTMSELPTNGSLSKTPWADSYWPDTQGGIAVRWGGNDDDTWKYTFKSAKEVAEMSLTDLGRLSPAEKFDIYNGNFDYPTVARERGRTSAESEAWEGICHGWAPAAINFDEPKPTLIEGANGIEIPFGSSDVKALLSYLQGEMANTPSRFLGERCNSEENLDSPECRDVNAGAFHIILTNMIGLRDEGFVADVTRSSQVWNHPVHAYTTRVVSTQEASDGAAPGTVSEDVIETVMTFTVEVDPSWDPLLDTKDHKNDTASYKYRVEKNAEGEIIGGEWLLSDHPDFLWVQDVPNFDSVDAQWKGLKAIYEASLSGANPAESP